jgi:hypothetical protein
MRLGWILLALAVAGCDGDDADPTDGGSADAPSRVDSMAPPMERCRPGTPWDPTRPAFVDVTDAWGLADLDGNTLAVGDLDGDGWPDLIAMGGPSEDPMTTQRGGGRLFLNRPRPDGGRRFEDFTVESNFFAVRTEPVGERLAAEPGYGRTTSLAALADVDNDGDLDAFSGFFRDHTQDATTARC